jgi:hypothetical protein
VTIAVTERAVRIQPELSPGRAAAMVAFAWLFAVLLAAFLPRYVPVFDHWPGQWGELPVLTRALMSVGRLGTWPIALAGVGLAAVLAGGAAGWVRTGLPGRRTVVLSLAAAGVLTCAACLAGTIGLVVTAPVVPVS